MSHSGGGFGALPPPLLGVSREAWGGCVSSFPLGGGDIGTVSVCFSSFMCPFLPYGVLEMQTFPPPLWEPGRVPLSHSLWSAQEDSPFLHEACPASPPVLRGLWGSIPFPHIFGGDAMGVFLSPFSFGGCMGPLPGVTKVGLHRSGGGAPPAGAGSPLCGRHGGHGGTQARTQQHPR